MDLFTGLKHRWEEMIIYNGLRVRLVKSTDSVTLYDIYNIHRLMIEKRSSKIQQLNKQKKEEESLRWIGLVW